MDEGSCRCGASCSLQLGVSPAPTAGATLPSPVCALLLTMLGEMVVVGPLMLQGCRAFGGGPGGARECLRGNMHLAAAQRGTILPGSPPQDTTVCESSIGSSSRGVHVDVGVALLAQRHVDVGARRLLHSAAGAAGSGNRVLTDACSWARSVACLHLEDPRGSAS